MSNEMSRRNFVKGAGAAAGVAALAGALLNPDRKRVAE